MEAALKAKRLGFCRILFSCSNSRVVQACNCLCSNSWQDMVMVADLRSLKQQGVCCKALHVPRSILDSIYCIADLATTIPGNHSWITLELMYWLRFIGIKNKKKRTSDFKVNYSPNSVHRTGNIILCLLTFIFYAFHIWVKLCWPHWCHFF